MMSCQADIDPDVCPASYFGHVCVLDDDHNGLHHCECGVRWMPDY